MRSIRAAISPRGSSRSSSPRRSVLHFDRFADRGRPPTIAHLIPNTDGDSPMTQPANTRQIRIERRSPSYWRVTFDHPPLNIFGPKTIPQLEEIIQSLEHDPDVKVVVFDSAVEGFFLTHYDFLAKPEETTSIPPGKTGLQALPDMLARLSRAPVVSIASIRGRATGVGSELALASDMRFASREK